MKDDKNLYLWLPKFLITGHVIQLRRDRKVFWSLGAAEQRKKDKQRVNLLYR